MKRIFFLFLILVVSCNFLFAQNVLTAMDVFNMGASKIGGAKDLEAEVKITIEDSSDMEAILFYKAPNKIRLSFSKPKNQVICSDGKKLTVYRPSTSVVMTQELRKGENFIPSIVDPSGFSLYRSNYNIAYNEGPDFVNLEGRNISVRQLKLTWKRVTSGYKLIIMSFDKSNNLVQLDGTTSSGVRFIYDFFNIKYNVGIADTRFTEYEAPSSAYEMENFLFDPEG